MTASKLGYSETVLSDLKIFQRRTAVWAFERMFTADKATDRFLVADEVGLGKTHVAKGVIAQVIDHLRSRGDHRQDIVYVCSNGAIARQNLRKLVPKGIQPLEGVERLTMLPLAELDRGGHGRPGVNLLAITPGTSLKFGHSTGQFQERCLAYAFLRAVWDKSVMRKERARWIFWAGVAPASGEARLVSTERAVRTQIKGSLPEFVRRLEETDRDRARHHKRPLRGLFDHIVDGLRWKHSFPDALWHERSELIGEVRRIMAIVGISQLRPDLVVLDEFQRFKDLLDPDPANFAAELAHRLFNFVDPDTGHPTKTLLLSATPYRMYSTADDPDGDEYADFISTCSFLFSDPDRVAELQRNFRTLRDAMTAQDSLSEAQSICAALSADLRNVMARTERLSATPNRDGMLSERNPEVSILANDLRAYMRFGDLAEAVDQPEPTEFWKAGPYLVNFMEHYRLKQAVEQAALDGQLPDGEDLTTGPGVLNWTEVEAYEPIDPENGRLRWLVDDLSHHRAFDLLWVPPSLRYYDTGSVYESPEALRFTKRLIFSGWVLVPKVVSTLVTLEAERRAYTERSHSYTSDYRQRGGQRLSFRTSERRAAAERRAGESDATRRAAAMTSFLLVWPSVTLAELGDPRAFASRTRPSIAHVLAAVESRVAEALAPLMTFAPDDGPPDQRWYWAAPLFLDQRKHPGATDLLLGHRGASNWGDPPLPDGFMAHLDEARAMLTFGPQALGRPPENLVRLIAALAIAGPAQCGLRAITAVTGLPLDDTTTLSCGARIASAFRSYFNGPEVTATVRRQRTGTFESEDSGGRYWRDVIQHAIFGNLQAVVDEHAHIVRDWRGHLDLGDPDLCAEAARDIAWVISEALATRTSSFRVDVLRPGISGSAIELAPHRMRTRFAVALGNQNLDEGGEARQESVSLAFNSPFWPFVLVSTSIGQEGLDFHLWCHAVVHWTLPGNPVDLEQREGRVHRYKCHAVRRNVAATIGPTTLAGGFPIDLDVWDELFSAARSVEGSSDEIAPYWVFDRGPAKIERLVPVVPFSTDAVRLPQLRKTLAAYRLAFGQPRQEELIEFLGADRDDAELLELASRLRIDLSPPVAG